MWPERCRAILKNHCSLPLLMLAMLVTQAGCPPNPIYVRTRTIDLPQPMQFQPVIVEHMEHHATYESRFAQYSHRFEATRYTLKSTDGLEMDVYVGRDNPYVVVRNPAKGEQSYLGLWSSWSKPGMEFRHPPWAATRPSSTSSGPTIPATQPAATIREVTP